MKPNTIKIDDVEYIRKDESNQPSEHLEDKPYVVIRSRDSGCHAGYLAGEDGTTVSLVRSRRLWYWSGASTLSQLSVDGVKNPSDCKFPCEVSITVYNICEKITTTLRAQKSIQGVPVWKQ